MKLMFLVKFILVSALLVAGTLFLLKGIGTDIPILNYAGLQGHDVPVGIVSF